MTLTMTNQTIVEPKILKGFRDFLPEELIARQFLIDKIKKTFEKFGFDPLETPALEYSETLLGKYGDDADKLLYLFEDRGKRKVGLRYDQTVPLARTIAQYPEIPKPFKRYQIQNVWRAENTQKGRYREFLQCDADIIGDNFSSTADAEILSLIWSIYQDLGFKSFKLVVNSRNLLKSIIDSVFGSENTKLIANKISLDVNRSFLNITRSLDKVKKIGLEGVKQELLKKGYPLNNVNSLMTKLQSLNIKSYKGLESIDRNFYYSLQIAIENFKIPENNIIIDPFMARGLDYYTGLIVEGQDDNYPSSLVGGGRYDNLIGKFTGKNIPAVGFAIGFDRTLEVAKLLHLIPAKSTYSKVIICIIEDWESVFPTVLDLTFKLRASNINTEIYLNPQEKNLDKQLRYANRKGIPYVVFVGHNEIIKNKFTLKNMLSSTQEELSIDQLIQKLS